MTKLNLIYHKDSKIIGDLIYQDNNNSLSIILNKDSGHFSKAIKLILENTIRKLDKEYQVENLKVHKCNKDYFNAIKQELFLKLGILAK